MTGSLRIENGVVVDGTKGTMTLDINMNDLITVSYTHLDVYKRQPEEWLDNFNTFSIYQVLPQLIELWGLNVKTDVEAKKNFVQQSVK